MPRGYRYIFLGLLLLGLAAFSWKVGHSQSADSEYFSQTGHFVEGDFLSFYYSAHDPQLVFGFPLTEAFINREGVMVQYFQRARFELTAGGQVRLTPIGRALYEPGRPLSNLDSNPATCRIFDTGFPVCMDFLAFFDAHGGVDQFGRPISRSEVDGMRIVQYFEYARLEWYPETDDPRLQVQLGLLGWLYFHDQKEDPGRLISSATPNVINITSLRVHAFPAATTAREGDTLSIFVVVQDQAFSPVEAADLVVAITGSDVLQGIYQVVTNAHGFAELTLLVPPGITPGTKVMVDVTASFAGLSKSTRTSFRVVP